MQGYLTGGWDYVIAAYGLSGALLAGYLVSVVVRLRAESRLAKVVQEEETETQRPNVQTPAGVTS